jgi:hypothetical protein
MALALLPSLVVSTTPISHEIIIPQASFFLKPPFQHLLPCLSVVANLPALCPALVLPYSSPCVSPLQHPSPLPSTHHTQFRVSASICNQSPPLPTWFVVATLWRIAIRDLFLGRYVLVFQFWLFKQQNPKVFVVVARKEETGEAIAGCASWTWKVSRRNINFRP